ncbi:MAG: SPOR domain-containing protein [Pseudomonadaceae bacterium]|nr:SPOR domain-containing protein [Pseudomonadaceae bacterium]
MSEGVIMDISTSETAERGWIVRLGLCAVPFRSQEAAERFVERLRQRLAAPHELPAHDVHQNVIWPAQDRGH